MHTYTHKQSPRVSPDSDLHSLVILWWCLYVETTTKMLNDESLHRFTWGDIRGVTLHVCAQACVLKTKKNRRFELSRDRKETAAHFMLWWRVKGEREWKRTERERERQRLNTGSQGSSDALELQSSQSKVFEKLLPTCRDMGWPGVHSDFFKCSSSCDWEEDKDSREQKNFRCV